VAVDEAGYLFLRSRLLYRPNGDFSFNVEDFMPELFHRTFEQSSGASHGSVDKHTIAMPYAEHVNI
jgi:hypothetical protein